MAVPAWPISSPSPSPRACRRGRPSSSPTSSPPVISVRLVSIRPGATVVVMGLGPVGIMALQCAPLFGAGAHPGRGHGARTPGAPNDSPSRSTPASHRGRSRCWRPPAGGACRAGDRKCGDTALDAGLRAAMWRHRLVVGEPSTGALLPMGSSSLKSLTLGAVFAAILGTWSSLVLLQSRRLAGLGETFTQFDDLFQAPEAYVELFDSADGTLKNGRRQPRARWFVRRSGSARAGTWPCPAWAGREELRRRRHDDLSQRVDDRPGSDLKLSLVPPGLVGVTLGREADRLERRKPRSNSWRDRRICDTGKGRPGDVAGGAAGAQAVDPAMERQRRAWRSVCAGLTEVERRRVQWQATRLTSHSKLDTGERNQIRAG